MDDKKMTIALIVDRSGSMDSIEGATMEGLNAFIHEQKQSTDIDVSLQIVQFDDIYEQVYSGPVAGAPRFTLAEHPKAGEVRFEPRGSTALHDAIGRTILEVGDELGKLPEEKRPSKVVIVIMTDGHENASKEFKRARIAEMIKHQQEVYNWQFQYLGANQDAVAVGESMNIPAANSMSYRASAAGARSMTGSVARNVRAYGATGQSVNMMYSKEDRAKAMAPDEEEPEDLTVSISSRIGKAFGKRGPKR